MKISSVINLDLFWKLLLFYKTIKDCFQVKSNLLTDFRFTTHMNIMRTESFARLTRKAHLYQSAMDRFHSSQVYHNRRFGESIQEGEMVDLIDKSEEAELDDSLKKKKKNHDRLSKRKAKSLAKKGSKLAEEPEAIQVQTPARDLPSSAVVSPSPESLDTDVEMTPAVALPVGELKVDLWFMIRLT